MQRESQAVPTKMCSVESARVCARVRLRPGKLLVIKRLEPFLGLFREWHDRR